MPLIPAYIWTEEMARFLFVWTIMIGAMVGMREGTHFEVDVWPDLGPRADRRAEAGRRGCSCWRSRWCSSGGAANSPGFARNRISELAELPLWMIHIAWPIAGFTWWCSGRAAL